MAKATKGAAEEIAGSCHAVRLRAVNRAISGVYDTALRAVGLKGSQLNVLVAISVSDQAQPIQLARALHMDKSTMSRNVDKMRAKGWIVSRELPEGGQQLRLSASGERLLEAALPLWREAQVQAEKLLGKQGVQAVRTLHKAVR